MFDPYKENIIEDYLSLNAVLFILTTRISNSLVFVYVDEGNNIWKDSGTTPVGKRISSDSVIKDIITYKIGAQSYLVTLHQDGTISVVHLNTDEFAPLTLKETFQACKIIFASDYDFKDLLILGMCNGEIWSVDFAQYLRSISSNQSFQKIYLGQAK